MPGLVNIETDRSVKAFIENIGNHSKEEDSYVLLNIIQEITKMEPKVWGNKKVPDFIIGFGKYTYNRKGAKEKYEWFHIGFAPRKTRLTLYLNFDLNTEEELLKRLGKCKWGKGCLYINKLKDIHLDILKTLIKKSKDAKWH